MADFRGWAVKAAKQKLEPISYDPGPLGPEDVEIEVAHCGLCHSDLSVLNNEWGNAIYPAVLGHEAVGRVVALGPQAKGLKLGQKVGVGWNAGSCMHCHQCLSGRHNLCPEAQATIIGHNGGFANRLRAHWAWAIPLPDDLDITSAGPMLCGGITVFQPFAVFDIKPTAHVGVVGIGGLGHLALRFGHAWGCELTAFTSSASKADEARGFGAHHVISSTDSEAIRKAANTLDFLIVTVNVPLDWQAMMATLRPNGHLHVVGVVLEPIPVVAFDLLAKQRRVAGSPSGAPATMATMLEFAARQNVAPQVEHFPMSRINDAFAHLAAGKARYRVVLDADFA